MKPSEQLQTAQERSTSLVDGPIMIELVSYETEPPREAAPTLNEASLINFADAPNTDLSLLTFDSQLSEQLGSVTQETLYLWADEQATTVPAPTVHKVPHYYTTRQGRANQWELAA